jgi:hypothetical protein
MTITRHASVGARRTWFRPTPRCLLGTTAGPNAAPAQHPGSKQMARIAAAIVAIAALAAAGVAGRAAVAASFAARRLARALPDAHLQLIEGAGHHRSCG